MADAMRRSTVTMKRKVTESEPEESDVDGDQFKDFNEGEKNYVLNGPDNSVTQLRVSQKTPFQDSDV
jgi:hypothetical protein